MRRSSSAFVGPCEGRARGGVQLCRARRDGREGVCRNDAFLAMFAGVDRYEEPDGRRLLVGISMDLWARLQRPTHDPRWTSSC